MVKITKIYTRTGDDGTTGLVSGARVAKTAPRVVAYGTVDEANAAVGMAVSALKSGGHEASQSEADRLTSQLTSIQHDLFDLGADLATPGDIEGALRILPSQVDRLEQEIDGWNRSLAPLTSFVLPGGCPAACAMHVARTVTRRAERKVVEVCEQEQSLGSEPASLRYLNRLSDLLFVMSRVANDGGKSDVLWVPGKSRETNSEMSGADGGTP